MQNQTTPGPGLQKHIGRLFIQSLRISAPLHMLHTIREKIQERGYQTFDKNDILDELGALQRILDQLNTEMLNLYNTLQKS